MSYTKMGNGTFEERRGGKENDIAPDTVRSREILSRTFEELELTLEQLRVAEEQLRQLSAALVEARGTAEWERRRYAELFASTPEAYLITTPEGAVREANPAACTLFGLPARALSRKHLLDLLAPDEHPALRETLRRRAGPEAPPLAQSREMRLRPRHDGEEILAAFTPAPHADPSGGPAGVRWHVRPLGELSRLLGEYELRERRLRAEWEHEHRIAETLQSTFLPDIVPDGFPGLSVVTLYQAALEEARVGGDFYDAFPVAGGKVALAVGDASGKGLRAATCAAEVRFALRAFLHEYPDPARALRRLNDFMCDRRGLDWGQDAATFLVLSLAVVDPATGECVVVRAGGEPPLVIRAGGACEMVGGGGLVLGYEPGSEYAPTPLRLCPGDMLLLVTDGITEARRGPGEFLGYEGMAALAGAAARQAAGDPEALCRALLAATREFGGGSLHDDACLLLAQRLD